MNRSAKGRRQLNRTREWLESLGYQTASLESRKSFFAAGKQRYSVSDIWGADVMAKNAKEMLFVQVKSSRGDMSKGKRELIESGPWPPGVRLFVAHWPHGQRFLKGPLLWELPSEAGEQLPLGSSPASRS